MLLRSIKEKTIGFIEDKGSNLASPAGFKPPDSCNASLNFLYLLIKAKPDTLPD